MIFGKFFIHKKCRHQRTPSHTALHKSQKSLNGSGRNAESQFICVYVILEVDDCAPLLSLSLPLYLSVSLSADADKYMLLVNTASIFRSCFLVRRSPEFSAAKLACDLDGLDVDPHSRAARRSLGQCNSRRHLPPAAVPPPPPQIP